MVLWAVAFTQWSCTRPDAGGPDAADSEYDLPALDLKLRSRIDGFDLGIGSIQEIVADDAGRVYVLDGQTREIVVLDPDGSRVASIGGSGQGPGEFESLSSMAWTGEVLATFDVRLQRFTFFDRTGQVLAVHSMDVPHLQAGSPALLSDGHTVYARLLNIETNRPAYIVLEGVDSIEAIPTFPETPRPPSGFLCATQDGSGRFPGIAVPFRDDTSLRTFLPNGEVAIARADSFVVDVHRARTGQMLRSVRRDYPRRSLTDEDWESLPETRNVRRLEAEHGRLLDRDERSACPYDEQRPEFWPMLRAIISDPTGRIWAESTARGGEGLILTVFDADGMPVGDASMPDRDHRVRPYARNDLLYVATVDEVDVQSIEIYELIGPAE